MKTSELISKIENLGFEVGDDSGFISASKRLTRSMVSHYISVSPDKQYSMRVRPTFENVEETKREKLVDLFWEYTTTPVEKREEAKKYYLVITDADDYNHGVFIQHRKNVCVYYIYDNEGSKGLKTMFTQEEIGKLPNQNFIKTLVKEEVK